MFTQACFINKNNSELRVKLKELGYKFGGKDKDIDFDGDSALYCNTSGEYFEIDPSKPACDDSIIDCGMDEELFMSIAALRDDADIYQWFVCDWDYEVYEDEEFEIIADEYHKKGDFCFDWIGDFEFNDHIENWHKATVQELIEHYKKLNELNSLKARKIIKSLNCK